MKLNYKRTVFVGFAFFLICLFWQAYDTIIPKILTDRFGLPQAISGVIMALDNILALFMLPIFGAISDRCRSRFGKRKPFIVVGTIVSVCAFLILGAVDFANLKAISSVSAIDDPASLEIIYDSAANDELMTPEGKKFVISERYTREDFASIKSKIYESRIDADYFTMTLANGEEKKIEHPKYSLRVVTYDGEDFFLRDRESGLDTSIGDLVIVNNETISLGETFDERASYASVGVGAFKEITNEEYTDYVSPVRQNYVGTLTVESPSHLVWFIILLMIVLIAMSTFRSPAVALMPDVTIKPLRSKANAVINLMGALGGAVVLVLGMGFAFNNSAVKNTYRPYALFFAVVGAVMIAALVAFALLVKERAWADEAAQENDLLEAAVAKSGESAEETAKEAPKKRGLTVGERRSLLLILASVFLWYFGYNAVTSKYSVYATNVLDLDYSTTLLIASVAALISYLPIGFISSKIGRKKVILSGVVMLSCAFFVACFLRVGASALIMNLMFALAGIGWAAINVNSFPMVVDMSSGSDIGKYTGYYYAASMAAQAITPAVSGLFMDKFGLVALFPYATIFVALAFLTMFFVRHGDSKPEAKKAIVENYAADVD